MQLEDSCLFPEVYELQQKMGLVWDHLNFADISKQSLVVQMQKSADALRISATRLLSNEPSGASLEAMNLWSSLKPLNCKIFDDFAAKADSDSPKIDLEECELKNDESGVHCFKMIHKKTGKRHGLVRMISSDGDVLEMSYRNGNRHGLKRAIYKDQVKVYLSIDGSQIAYLYFDENFYETERGGPKVHLLADITADMFRQDDDVLL